MLPLTIHPTLQFLLLLALVPVFSLLVLCIGLYIKAGQKDEPKIIGDTHSKPSEPPSVMGASRQLERQSPPNEATESQTENHAEKPATFAREIPKAELDHVFGTEQTDKMNEREDPDPDDADEVDLQDEETDLQMHRTADDADFATGVSFGELRQATRLMQKAALQPDEQKTVSDTAAKLAHTDLWDKVMAAMPGANDKIAKMLHTPPETAKTADDWKSFDIRNFI